MDCSCVLHGPKSVTGSIRRSPHRRQTSSPPYPVSKIVSETLHDATGTRHRGARLCRLSSTGKGGYCSSGGDGATVAFGSLSRPGQYQARKTQKTLRQARLGRLALMEPRKFTSRVSAEALMVLESHSRLAGQLG